MGPNNGPSAAFNPNSYPPRDALKEVMNEAEDAGKRLCRMQVAGMIFAALAAKSNFSSLRDMAEQTDMRTPDLCARLASMVCDACERV